MLGALGVDTYAFPAHSRNNATMNMRLSRRGDRYGCRYHVFANLLLDPLVGARIGHLLLLALLYSTFRHFNGLGCLHVHGLRAGAGTASATSTLPLSLYYVVASSVIRMAHIAGRLNLLVQNGVLGRVV